MNPGVYGAWIEHLVRSGQIVIYPRYMDVDTPVPDYLPNAVAGIVDALGVLEIVPRAREAGPLAVRPGRPLDGRRALGAGGGPGEDATVCPSRRPSSR